MKTNILFAIADDASHFGIYDHSFVKTPNIDKLGKEGLVFNNMFTTNPKCAPSRVSILSGKHTWQLKEACNHSCFFPAKEELDIYPDILEENNFHVGYTGKGWGPGDYIKNGRNRNPAGNEYNNHQCTPPPNSRISNKDYPANFREFLDAQPDDQPFCFWFGAHEPHRQYTPGEGIHNGKSLDEITEVPPYWPDNEIVRSDMLDYAFEIEWFDKQIGCMVEELEKRGELENTLIIITSDNGCPFPRVKGQMFDDDFRLPFVAHWPNQIKQKGTVDELCSFIDLLPTFYEIAGIDVAEELPGTSLMDIFNGKPEKRSRAFMGREKHDLGREGDLGYPVRCIRTPEHLLCVNYEPNRWPAGNPETGFPNCDSSPTKELILEMNEQGEDFYFQHSFGKRPKYQLYNIKEDPFCMNNLADKDTHQQLKNELIEELTTYLQGSSDPRELGDKDVFDNYPQIKADTAHHSWKAFKEGRFKPQKH